FTPDGRVNITASRYRDDFGPVDETCDCYTCANYTAAYLNHLFRAKELLAYRLATIHNLRFIQREMEAIRGAIARGTFQSEMAAFLERYRPADEDAARTQRRRWVERRAGEAP
ncbi:MAG: tRNA-guanine transglycosylase, partial [Thermomicrobiaceae bacterium]|nr:tRNA-guanine transglycosylase [Thermomicrobiaceae bacterium]